MNLTNNADSAVWLSSPGPLYGGMDKYNSYFFWLMIVGLVIGFFTGWGLIIWAVIAIILVTAKNISAMKMFKELKNIRFQIPQDRTLLKEDFINSAYTALGSVGIYAYVDASGNFCAVNKENKYCINYYGSSFGIDPEIFPPVNMQSYSKKYRNALVSMGMITYYIQQYINIQ